MRTVICLFFTLLPFYLSGQALLDTKLDIRLDNISVEDALLYLSEKANCSISFNSNNFSDDQKINLQIENKSLQYILERCLNNTGFTFSISSDNIISLVQLPPPIYTISGFVEDSLSNERLVAATVYDFSSGKGTTTNEYGFYSLSIPKGKAKINYSYLGFRSREYEISIQKDLHYTVGLNAALTLQEVVVTDSKILPQEQIGTYRAPNFKSKQSNQIPTLGGEPDVLKYFHTLPGVQSGADGFVGMRVRGGNADQNLILLDGVPVYNPSHTLGLFSIFNANTIKNATLYKGYLPAQYSGRLSSVIDVRTREGNSKTFHGGISSSLFATSAFVEGPIKQEKTSFLVSARRTHLDPIINGIAIDIDSTISRTGYHFYDTNLKLNHAFSKKDHLYISYYDGRDIIQVENEETFEDILFEEIKNEDPSIEKLCQNSLSCDSSFVSTQSNFLNFDWGNTIFALRWNHLWNNKLFSNTSLTYSEFTFNSYYGAEDYYEPTFWEEEEEEEDIFYSKVVLFQLESIIQDSGLKVDFDYVPNTKNHFKFGGGLLVRQFTPSLLSDEFESEGFEFDIQEFEDRKILSNQSYLATEVNAYIEDDIQLTDKWKAQLGLHAVAFIAPNKIYPSIQPRLAFQYQFHPKGQLIGSVNRMNQFLHVLKSTRTAIPTNLWVPSTDKVRPQNSWQTDLGVHWTFAKGINASLEGYYKKMNRLITYRESTIFLLEPAQEFDWENEVAVGQGWSYGIEAAFSKSIGKTTGWLNYNLAWSDRQYDLINNGQKFPYQYNRKHLTKIGISHQFGRVFNLFATWQYGSGQWTTVKNIDIENFEIDSDILHPFPFDPTLPINTYQLKAFHRLDIMANFDWSKKRCKHQLSVGLNNVYGRDNPFLAFTENNDPSTRDEVGLGIPFPTLRYGVRF